MSGRAVTFVALLAACSPQPVALPDITGAVRTTNAHEACKRPLPPRPDAEQWRRLKRAVATRMGYRGRLGEMELDHLIPRELGGADTMDNLWLEPWPQAKQKDRIENITARDFCSLVLHTEDGLHTLQGWFATAQWAKEIKP